MATTTLSETIQGTIQPVRCNLEGKEYPLEVCLSQQTGQLTQGLGQALTQLDAKITQAQRAANYGMWFSGIGLVITVAIIAVVTYLRFKK